MSWYLVILSVLLTALPTWAEMPPEQAVKAVADAWIAKQPAHGFGAPMTMAEAAQVGEQFRGLVAKDLGPVVGYKAALTNPAVQQRFGYNQPLRGTLFAGMLVSGPARMPARYGCRPVLEADMVAVVGDPEKLMAAKTPLEVLAGLAGIRPFIELPDLVFDPQVKLDGPTLLAINAAARAGVLGPAFTLPATPESVAALAGMRAELTDQTGAVLGAGKGSDTLDNPLNAVLWIAESLRAEGQTLEVGQLLSLGSFSPLLPPKPGLTVTLRYHGLTVPPPEVTVSFD